MEIRATNLENEKELSDQVNQGILVEEQQQ